MAVEIFLKIDGVDGESLAKGHEGEIEIFSYSLGASNPSSVGTGSGSGAGKVDISSISLQKQVDLSSTKLFQNCCKGTHYPKAILTVREAGGESPLEYVVITIEQVFVDSVSWGGAAGGGKPSESVSLSFAKVNFKYVAQGKSGSEDKKDEASWNVQTNAAS